MYLAKKPVHKYEAYGFMITIIGIILAFVLPSSGRKDHHHGGILLDLALFLSSFAALGLFTLNKALMKGRIIIHLALLNLFTTLAFCMLALLFDDIAFDSNPHNGLFGWVANQD